MIKGQAELATGEYVSGDYFRGLDVLPAAGRMIISGDDRPDSTPVAVLSNGLAQRRFGGAPNAIGQSILIDNHPFVVIGVTPAEFFGVDPARVPEFYVPLHSDLLLDQGNPWGDKPEKYLNQNYYWIQVMARLRSGTSMAQVQATLAPQFHQWVANTATNDREREALPELQLSEGAAGLDTLRRKYSKPLYVLFAMVALILAIACANTANLLLARASVRRREMAVRLSMGAGRLRVVRQMLTESVLLASLGGALGIIFAVWGMRLLSLLVANREVNSAIYAELNWPVLGVTLALSLLCGVLFGLAPAFQSTRADVIPALKERSATARTRHAFLGLSLSRALVISQIVISLLLLFAAGLFLRTLSNMQAIQLGFNRENILLFDLNARQAGYLEPGIVMFYEDLRKQFAAIPGVRNATLSHSSLIGAGRGLSISVAGVPAAGTRVLNAGPGFFSTMQIPILAGREIDERDRRTSTPVVVVNELFAKTYFGGKNPLGRHVTLGGPSGREMEIVGVSSNVQYGSLRQTRPPVVFMPYNQGYPPVSQMTYALRTSGDPLVYAKSVREIVHQADPRVPVTNILTETQEIAEDMNQEILFARLCTGFALLALTIACVGLYGTMSYNFARRRSEIGIRMALGAGGSRVVWMVMREVLALTAAALAISLPTALAASKLVQSFLFRLKPNDPEALISAVLILFCAAIAAGYLPARNASRIDPIAALRNE